MLAYRTQGTKSTVLVQENDSFNFVKELPSSLVSDELPQPKTKKQPLKNTNKTKNKTPHTRVGRSQYVATSHNQKIGLIDKNQIINGHSILLLHVPKKYNNYILDVHVGDILQAQPLRLTTETFNLQVTFVGRSKYFRPGKRISSCMVGVETEAWTSFKKQFIKKTQQ